MRLVSLACASVVALALAGSAGASQLVARNASHIKLAVNRKGTASSPAIPATLQPVFGRRPWKASRNGPSATAAQARYAAAERGIDGPVQCQARI